MTIMYSKRFIIFSIFICFQKHVKGFLKITDITPTPYRLIVGGEFSLTCVYNGETMGPVDSCQLQFFKDGIHIPVGKEFRTYMTQDGNNVSFTIFSNRDNGTVVQDGGKYECRYRTIKFRKYVEIFDVEATVTNDTDKEGTQNVEIKCEAMFSVSSSRDNSYSIDWYKGNTPVEDVKSLHSRYTEGDNKITIYNAVKEDMGKYQCVFVFKDNNDRVNYTVDVDVTGHFKSSNAVKIEYVTFIHILTFFCWLYDYARI